VSGLPALLDRARALATRSERAVLGIVGPPGAGKTTLAEQLVAGLVGQPPPGCGPDWVVHVPLDGYHLADVELTRLGRLDRKGAPDTFDPAGYAALLDRLRSGSCETVYAPAFDRTIEQPVAGSIPVHPAARLVVTEGNYLLLDTPAWVRVRERLDEVWFSDVDPEERVRRLVARHVRFGKTPEHAAAWVQQVDEPNAALVEATRVRADLVVPSDALPLP
jgi:pantothenate kinase